MARFRKNEMNQRTGFVSIDLAFNSKHRVALVSSPTCSNTHVFYEAGSQPGQRLGETPHLKLKPTIRLPHHDFFEWDDPSKS